MERCGGGAWGSSPPLAIKLPRGGGVRLNPSTMGPKDADHEDTLSERTRDRIIWRPMTLNVHFPTDVQPGILIFSPRDSHSIAPTVPARHTGPTGALLCHPESEGRPAGPAGGNVTRAAPPPHVDHRSPQTCGCLGRGRGGWGRCPRCGGGAQPEPSVLAPGGLEGSQVEGQA